MSSPGFLLPHLSIKHRLPLLIGTLLVAVIVASTGAAYRGVKQSAFEVGHERLLNLTQQLASLTQQSTALLLTKTHTAANDPAIRAFLQSPSQATRTNTNAIFQQFTAAHDPNGLQAELWDANRTLRLTLPDQSSPISTSLDPEFKQSAQAPFKAVGPLRIINNVVVSPAVAAVKSDDGAVIGYLVRWRRTSANPGPRGLKDLLGSEATVYIGNSSGDVWTNFATVVSKPPSDLGSTLEMTHYMRDGESVMALGRPIGGTPFFLIVEFPDRVFFGQAWQFLRRVVFIDLALLVIGVVGTLLLSRSITRPLNLLTASATAISNSDYSRRVHIARKDELGALGNAFNAMVARLRASQLNLERKVHELKSVEHSASKLAAIVESSHDAIIGRKLDGTITSWNMGATKLYGYSAEETIGHSPENLLPREGPDEIATIIRRLQQGESIDHFETKRIAKDGKSVLVSLTVSPILDDSGALIGTSTISRDITRQKQAEVALQNSEMRYRRLFESAKDGILILDAETGEILDVNPHLNEMLGFSREELLGKQLWGIGPFQDIVGSKRALVELQQRGILRYDNLALETRDGSIKQVELVSNSYLAGSSPVIQCNIRDITERKLAEEELLRTNQQLEGTLAELQTKTQELASMTQQLWQASKLATMGELAASVAHELNNPLATISLRLESLAEQLTPDSQKSRSVEIVADEVERMGKLVGSLLEFSRRGHPQVSTIQIEEEIEKAIELIDHYLRSRRIEVIQEFEAGMPTIQADRQQLRQVFLNLLTNASDAMPEGGRLIARTKHAGGEKASEGVSVEFADAGLGISPTNLEQVWEPFFTTKPEGKGTGLGLAICRRVIEEHNGTISITSRLGEGTTVTICLPATNGQMERCESGFVSEFPERTASIKPEQTLARMGAMGSKANA